MPDADRMCSRGGRGPTQVDDANSPPGLHIDVQRGDGQKFLSNALVHTPQQLLGLALVHDGNVLIAAYAYLLHYVCSLHVKRRVLSMQRKVMGRLPCMQIGSIVVVEHHTLSRRHALQCNNLQ